MAVKWKMIQSMRDKKELSLLISQPNSDNAKIATYNAGSGMKDLMARIENFARDRQVKCTWLANECKFRVNVYDDSKWWREMKHEAESMQQLVPSFYSQTTLSDDGESEELDDLDNIEEDANDENEAEIDLGFYSASGDSSIRMSERTNTNDMNCAGDSLESAVVCGPVIPPLIASCEISLFLQRNNKDFMLQFRKSTGSSEPMSSLVLPLLYYELKICLSQLV
jgi:hypothetical protein